MVNSELEKVDRQTSRLPTVIQLDSGTGPKFLFKDVQGISI
jgi:hypothetical protein